MLFIHVCNICLYLISQQCAASHVIPFDAQRKPPGRLGILHGWIGVIHCASYRTENNNPVLKKGFQSQKRQNKKITIIANFLKTEALCTMDLKEARSVVRFSRLTSLGQQPSIFKSKWLVRRNCMMHSCCLCRIQNWPFGCQFLLKYLTVVVTVEKATTLMEHL